MLGSFADGGRRELSLFLAEWQSGRPGLDVEIEVDELRAVTVLPIPPPPSRRCHRLDVDENRAGVVRAGDEVASVSAHGVSFLPVPTGL